MKTITIDGNTISNMEDFYDEVQRKFCPKLIGFGRNLDAFNDVVDGSFIGINEGEPLKIVWDNSAKSKDRLGYAATLIDLKIWRESDQPHWEQDEFQNMVDERIDELRRDRKPTLYDVIIDIIKGHKQIEFIEI